MLQLRPGTAIKKNKNKNKNKTSPKCILSMGSCCHWSGKIRLFMLIWTSQGLEQTILAHAKSLQFSSVQSLQSYPTLCDPMDHSLPCFSVHGILQARILERAAIPSSRGSSQPMDLIYTKSEVKPPPSHLQPSGWWTQTPTVPISRQRQEHQLWFREHFCVRRWENTKRRIKMVPCLWRGRHLTSESLSKPKKSYHTVTTDQGKVGVVHSLLQRLAASPGLGFQEHSKGLWQIYMSAGSQLTAQTLLLEQEWTWRLAGWVSKHTLPVTAGAGCSGGRGGRRVQ